MGSQRSWDEEAQDPRASSQLGRDFLSSVTYCFVQVPIRDSGYRVGIGPKPPKRVQVTRDW